MICSKTAKPVRKYRFVSLAMVLKSAFTAFCLLLNPPVFCSQVFQDGEYTVHVFTADGTFEPPPGVSEVDVLVVAGGGGGGGGGGGAPGSQRAGGGGGAGGLIYISNLEVQGIITAAVGAGGGGRGGPNPGQDGENSSFGGLVTAAGGGGGGSAIAPGYDGRSGGSGGGGGPSGSGSAGLAGQGFSGGSGYIAPGGATGAGGGGGGAGAPGLNADSSADGAGGQGIFFSQFVTAGDGGWFAGGGGGGGSPGYAAGAGGAGGGGDGGFRAIANTGGGGGGGDDGAGGRDGGSGVVIVRYLTPASSISISEDVYFAVGPGIVIAGRGQPLLTAENAVLSWISVTGGGTNKITARISEGNLPAGLELRLDCDRAAEIVLTGTPKDFIAGIGDESEETALLYTLEAVDFGMLYASSATFTVEFTIQSE